MKKRVFTAFVCLLLAILFLLLLCYGCWFLRRDCLCYQAMFHPGESLPIDEIVLNYASPQSGVMAIQVLECKQGQKLWLNIAEEGYDVQCFGK